MSELSDLQTDANSAKADGKFVVSVTVGNTGDHLRGEVVQVYVRFPASEVERPTTQPKGIQHVTVDAGKTEIVEVTMNATDLDYWNLGKQAWTVEPGPVDLLDGHSPAVAHLALSATVTVSG